jgi:eukaryotic translation initiation factor 2C
VIILGNPPAVNANFIVNEGLGQLGLRSPAAATLNGFGITIDTEMTVVPGRILPAPRLSYLGGKSTNVNNGSWNILDVKFQRPGVLGPWAVIIVQDFQRKPFRGPDDPDLLQLTNGFWNKLKSSGIDAKIAPIIRPTPPLPGPVGDPGRQKALDMIEQTMKSAAAPGKKPSLFLFLLSGRDDFIYPGIKKLCDMKLGVASVCMQLQKARGDPGKQDQYFSNVRYPPCTYFLY